MPAPARTAPLVPQSGRLRALALLYAATAALLGLAALAAQAAGKPLGYLTREPVEAVSQSGEICSGAECSYAGLVSNVGVLIGCAGAVTCFLVAWILRSSGARGENVLFITALGALTSTLVLDDLFMLHEYVVPELVGGGEKVVLLAYLVAGAAFLARFRRALAATHAVMLFAAGGLFAASVAADKLLDHVHLVEDGAKLFGLVTLTAYLVFTALDLLAERGGRAAA